MPSQSWEETLITAQVDGAAVTAAAATTLLPAAAKYTLPPNFFRFIGQRLRITAHGRITSLITTPGTARFDIRLGGVVVWDSLAILLDTVVAHTDKPWWLEVDLTLRALGASANFIGSGRFISENILGSPAAPPKASAIAMLPWNTAPVVGGNFDSAASQVADLFFTQTVATGSVMLHQYSLIAPN